jgi:magnesium-transporting ATPase (P-type)
MYDESSDQPTLASNTGVADELGQIQCVFTDKTGTLTENRMILKRCSIGQDIFGATSDEDTDLSNDMRLAAAIRDISRNDIERFFVNIALNHSLVSIDNGDKNSIPIYRGQSPDEESLVNVAARLGFVYLSKVNDEITLVIQSSTRKYSLLNILEFTSERKRSSIIVQEESGNRDIYLFAKGADDVILNLSVKNDIHARTRNSIELFAQYGYRTLCFGKMFLGESN